MTQERASKQNLFLPVGFLLYLRIQNEQTHYETHYDSVNNEYTKHYNFVVMEMSFSSFSQKLSRGEKRLLNTILIILLW